LRDWITTVMGLALAGVFTMFFLFLVLAFVVVLVKLIA
jgi:hypothetical protein